MLKDEDRRILRYLQSDPTLNPAELAEQCRISPQSVTRRLARLQDLGEGRPPVLHDPGRGDPPEARGAVQRAPQDGLEGDDLDALAPARFDRNGLPFQHIMCIPYICINQYFM